jgi:glycosyltransferase involved in cell wall biosynthesis
MDANTILTVMPIYNAEKTLKAAVDSILAQTYTNIHLVLVDDCSTDGSLSIAMKYQDDKRVTLIRNKENLGAYYCRNIGLYKFRNQPWGFFTTHDADDVSRIDRFTLMHKHFRNTRTVAVQDTWERRRLSTKESISVSLTCAHAMFRREVFNKLGYFEMMRFGADWEHWARVNQYNKSNKTISRSLKEITGNSYVAKTNLTEQIPAGSGPREVYIAKKKVEHDKAEAEGKIIYRNFNPKMRAQDVEGYKLPSAPIKGAALTAGATPEKPRYNNVRITVVLLTWQRLGLLKGTLDSLCKQTFQNFEVYISNANLPHEDIVEKTTRRYSDRLKIRVGHDGNDLYAFRRMTVGKRLAEEGTDIILFIDDDITFDEKYVETMLRHYEPKSYKSGFAWNFQNNGSDYYGKRTRVSDQSSVIHYCGTGISIVDASIFLDKKLVSSAPPSAIKIEDLWLSYYAQQVKKWKLGYVPVENVVIGGSDSVALYKNILNDKKKSGSNVVDKADFLRQLVKEYDWKLPAKRR